MIEVWLYRLSTLANEVDEEAAKRGLSREENNYLETVSSSVRYQEFLYTRFALRRLLSEKLQTPPNHIALGKTPEGKPTLVSELTWRFNLSHANDMAAIILNEGVEVGIDVLCLDGLKSSTIAKVTQRYFTHQEKAYFEAQDESRSVDVFARQWTLKEAMLKAVGCGLKQQLDQLDTMTMANNGQTHVLRDEVAHVVTAKHLRLTQAPYALAFAFCSHEALEYQINYRL